MLSYTNFITWVTQGQDLKLLYELLAQTKEHFATVHIDYRVLA